MKYISLWVSLMTLLSVFITTRNFASPDAYEPDNTLRNAKPIQTYDPRPDIVELGYDWFQSHNFYDSGDEDWVRFYAFSGQIYTIKVKDPGAGCNAVIGIYNRCGDLQIPEEVNDEPVGVAEYAEFICRATGVYYARIRQSSSAGYGEGTDYKLVLFTPVAEEDGFLEGYITPPVPEADAETTGKGGRRIKAYNGIFREIHPPGPFTLNVNAMGYEKYTEEIRINEGAPTPVNVTLEPVEGIYPQYHSADYNPPDHELTLSEMLRVQQLYRAGTYRCDPGGEDGYALGNGEQNCEPHSSDYAPQDWNISISEFLRLLQLWYGGSYHADLAGEDGFSPGASGMRRPAFPPVQAAITRLSLRHHVTGTAVRGTEEETFTASHSAPESNISDDSELIITNQISYTGGLTGLGMSVNLPNKWIFLSAAGDDSLTVRADSVTGDLEIFWSETPASPVQFTYTVKVPREETRYQGKISSRLLYRRPSAGEMTRPAIPDPLFFEIRLKGDINGDDAVTLSDALTALKTVAGSDSSGIIREDYVSSGIDADGDGRVGMAEVIYVLQDVAGLRQTWNQSLGISSEAEN